MPLLLLVSACSSPQAGPRSVSDEPARQRESQPDGGFVPQPEPESDERPWASAFANYTLEQAGVRGTRDPRALSWRSWGTALDRPAVGAIAVLDFGGGRGHVGFVQGTYGGMIVLQGGDQSNAVNSTAFAPDHIAAYRWPAGQPLPASAYDLPEVRPTDAGDGHAVMPRASAPSTSTSSNAAEYRSDDQTLRIERLADDRIRFQLAVRPCSRALSGIAYEIYPGDAQIDAEEGVGYPAREYLYWGDVTGTVGVSLRLSIAGPPRARVIEWGYPAECPFSKSVMRG
ncbi:MAG TPA: TIGR02594 family protein [Longimicrobium sp.]|nr:TIGR02594 family protein [Longimicrobium sp.]